MPISNEEKKSLFDKFRHHMGAPIRKVELEEEQLCTALELAIDDYSEQVQHWLIEHQWQSVLGKDIDSLDMAFALSTRSLDYATQFTFAYSKQVGLQSRGPWELKKDYIEIESGKQVYQIPAGREVNEVLWVTPSTTGMALYSNYGGMDSGFAGGFGQVGIGGGGMGGAGMAGGMNITPAYDILLTASDLNLKQRLFRSDLVYKMTAGPDGTKLLHLISTPGSRMSFGGGGLGAGGIFQLPGCQVWYYYYDTTPENVDQCRLDNPDIIKMPNDVPLSKLDYSSFNEPTKVLIRQLFFAWAKQTLGNTRGKFGGIVGVPGAERTMDYEFIRTEGVREREDTLKKIEERLERLSTTKQLERVANEAEYLNRYLKHKPLGFYAI